MTRKGKKRTVDLKQAITDLAVKDDSVIVLSLSHRGPSVKVGEALREIFELNDEEVVSLRIRKVGVEFKE